VTWISTEVKWFVPSETTHPQRVSQKICRQLLGFSAKFIQLPRSCNGKDSLICDSDHHQHPIRCCYSHIPPQTKNW